MSELMGNFSDVINRMDDDLHTARATWTDPTGMTYDGINENMKIFAVQMQTALENARAGHSAVKSNYNAGEFENTVQELFSKASTVL